jgi:uncharacterized protein YkwD
MQRARLLFAAAAAVFAMLIGTPLAQGEGAVDETHITLRHELLNMINHDRKAHGLPTVELDAYASSIADGYCRAQLRNGTTGHFTTDGQPPYMRYSFAGGNDGVSENAAAWSAEYTLTDRSLFEMMRDSEATMLGEKPPHDGHRQTLLDPFATHVGIGLAWRDGEFRLTQEFIRRYVEWLRPIPRRARSSERMLLSGRPLPGYRVDAISVHYEPMPQALSATTANAISSYGLPDDRRDYLPRLKSVSRRARDGAVEIVHEEYTDGRKGDFPVDDEGSFAFAVPFPKGSGVYTIVVWISRAGHHDSIAASNISVRVDDGNVPAAGNRGSAR